MLCSLTLPFSSRLVSIPMVRELTCHIMRQKSLNVFGRGPGHRERKGRTETEIERSSQKIFFGVYKRCTELPSSFAKFLAQWTHEAVVKIFISLNMPF